MQLSNMEATSIRECTDVSVRVHFMDGLNEFIHFMDGLNWGGRQVSRCLYQPETEVAMRCWTVNATSRRGCNPSMLCTKGTYSDGTGEAIGWTDGQAKGARQKCLIWL